MQAYDCSERGINLNWSNIVFEVLKRHYPDRVVRLVHRNIVYYYPGPEYLGRADTKHLLQLTRDNKIQEKHLRQLIRLSSLWYERPLTELPGVTQQILEKLSEDARTS